MPFDHVNSRKRIDESNKPVNFVIRHRNKRFYSIYIAIHFRVRIGMEMLINAIEM